MKKVAVQWIVENVNLAVEFYSKELGFKIDFLGDGPLFAILSRNNFSVMLRQLHKKQPIRPNRIPFIESGWHTKGKEAWDVYVWVEDVDKLYEEYLKKDVSIIKPIQDSEYGIRDFEISI